MSFEINPAELLIGLLLAIWTVHALTTGWITSGNGPRIYRNERPKLFWFLAAITAAMAATLIIDTLVVDL